MNKDGEVISLVKDMGEEFNKFFISILLIRVMRVFLKPNGCIKDKRMNNFVT